MKSLGEILDRGLYHTALEAHVPAAQRRRARARATRRAARAIKRVALRQAVEAVLERASAGGARVSDAAPEARAHRRGAGRYRRVRSARIPGCRRSACRPASPTMACRSASICSARRSRSRSCCRSATRSSRRSSCVTPFSTPALVAGKAPSPRTVTVAAPSAAAVDRSRRRRRRFSYLRRDHRTPAIHGRCRSRLAGQASGGVAERWDSGQAGRRAASVVCGARDQRSRDTLRRRSPRSRRGPPARAVLRCVPARSARRAAVPPPVVRTRVLLKLLQHLLIWLAASAVIVFGASWGYAVRFHVASSRPAADGVDHCHRDRHLRRRRWCNGRRPRSSCSSPCACRSSVLVSG